jgi:hypothetical protein
MFIQYIILLIVAIVSIGQIAEAVTFDGPCPHIKGPPFSCAKEFGSSKKYFVMAHLPTTNYTLNLYYSPVEDLKCLQATIHCYGDADTSDEKLLADTSMFFAMEHLQLETVDMALNASPPPTMDGVDEEIYSPLILAEHIDLQHNDGAVLYHPEFYRAIDNCTVMKEKMWTNMTVVKTVPHQYTVLWGCHNLPNGKHEEGAWILGYRKNYTDIKAKHFEAAMKELTDLKSSATHKDYIINEMKEFSVAGCAAAPKMDMDVFGGCRVGDKP